MARQARISIDGGIYHVIQRGLERRKLFKESKDRKEFLCRLEAGLKATGHHCYAWVLMDNHFHLVIRTSTRSLSDLMRKLLTGYALYFNKKYKRTGYLYQGRYKSILCQEDTYLLELVRYVHLNPIRANIVKTIPELNKYKWSGHSVIVGSQKMAWQNKSELLSYFGKAKQPAIKKYINFITDAKDIGKRDDLVGGGMVRSFGGWKAVKEMRAKKEKWLSDERILGESNFVIEVLKAADEKLKRKDQLKKAGWTIERVVQEVCNKLNISEQAIHQERRRSKAAEARSLIIYYGYQALGMTGAALAAYFNITRASISVAVNRGRKLAEKTEYLNI